MFPTRISLIQYGQLKSISTMAFFKNYKIKKSVNKIETVKKGLWRDRRVLYNEKKNHLNVRKLKQGI